MKKLKKKMTYNQTLRLAIIALRIIGAIGTIICLASITHSILTDVVGGPLLIGLILLLLESIAKLALTGIFIGLLIIADILSDFTHKKNDELEVDNDE